MNRKAGILFGTLTVAFLFLSSIACFDVLGDSSGTRGNLSWEFNDGKLTITGSGSMNDSNWDSEKWGNNDIRSVEIDKGVTSIGKYAFADFKNLEFVTISNSVKTIDDYAFYKCVSLKSIDIPDSVKTIGNNAFYDCTSLKYVIIPDSVESIGDDAFYNCISLKSINILKSAKIGKGAFAGCTVVPESIVSS